MRRKLTTENKLRKVIRRIIKEETTSEAATNFRKVLFEGLKTIREYYANDLSSELKSEIESKYNDFIDAGVELTHALNRLEDSPNNLDIGDTQDFN